MARKRRLRTYKEPEKAKRFIQLRIEQSGEDVNVGAYDHRGDLLEFVGFFSGATGTFVPLHVTSDEARRHLATDADGRLAIGEAT